MPRADVLRDVRHRHRGGAQRGAEVSRPLQGWLRRVLRRLADPSRGRAGADVADPVALRVQQAAATGAPARPTGRLGSGRAHQATKKPDMKTSELNTPAALI